jgi:circadian clock protein KaiC
MTKTSLKMERIGIDSLDAILNGGITERSVVLVEGTPGIGKEILGYHFLFTGIKQGEKCAYVFARKTIEEVEEEFAAYGMEIDRKKLTWIDASESQLATGSNIVNCNIAELFTVSAAIKNFLAENKGEKIRILIEIISPALMTNPSLEVYKHLSAVITEIKKYNATAFMLIEEGMHDPQIVTSIEQLCDYVIDMKVYEHEWDIKPMLRIKKTKTTPPPLQYFRFAVSNRGLTITV